MRWLALPQVLERAAVYAAARVKNNAVAYAAVSVKKGGGLRRRLGSNKQHRE